MARIETRLIKLERCVDSVETGPSSLALRHAVWQFDSWVNSVADMSKWLAEHGTPDEQAAFSAWGSSSALTPAQVAVIDAIQWPDYYLMQYRWHAQKFGALDEAMQAAAVERWQRVGCEDVNK